MEDIFHVECRVMDFLYYLKVDNLKKIDDFDFLIFYRLSLPHFQSTT